MPLSTIRLQSREENMLYEQFRPKAEGQFRNRCRKYADEFLDVFHDAFIAFLNAKKKFMLRSEEGYFMTIFHNETLAFLRNKKSHDGLTAFLEDFPAIANRMNQTEAYIKGILLEHMFDLITYKALPQLDDNSRLIIEYRYLQGLSYAEIVEQWPKTITHVNARKINSMAIHKLAAIIENESKKL